MARGAGLVLFAWFVYLVQRGLTSWFDADDLMNMYYYWSRSWPALLKSNLAFWSTYYRPAGGLFYALIYKFYGFHPLPFHIAAFVLMCVNFGLLAVVVYELTGSRWCVLLALMTLGINPTFAAAYYDTGTIYDVLAYTFCWGAFAWYVRIRRTRVPGWVSTALLFCLLIAALDAKEISVVLPAAVGLYELVWHPPRGWRPVAPLRWLGTEGRFAVIGVIADVVFVVGKQHGPDSLWNMAAYKPHYSIAAYFGSLAHYIQVLIYKPVTISSVQAGALLAAMLVVAALTRLKFLWWGVIFVLVSLLPLAFIPGRGGFAYLVPSVGWAVYLGGLLHWLIEKLTGPRARLRAAVQLLLLVLLFVILAPWQRYWLNMHAHAAHEMQGRFQRYESQIRELIPSPRKGARILLLTDADGYVDWDVFFLIRLSYGDPQLVVDRAEVYKEWHTTADPAKYDYVLDWANGKFVRVR